MVSDEVRMGRFFAALHFGRFWHLADIATGYSMSAFDAVDGSSTGT